MAGIPPCQTYFSKKCHVDGAQIVENLINGTKSVGSLAQGDLETRPFYQAATHTAPHSHAIAPPVAGRRLQKNRPLPSRGDIVPHRSSLAVGVFDAAFNDVADGNNS